MANNQQPALLPLSLAVIVPTFNERPNIRPLVEAVSTVLRGQRWELIFVDDDSPDGTAEAVTAIAQEYPNVRCLRRIGRRGLASAVVEGMLATSVPFAAVMDADF